MASILDLIDPALLQGEQAPVVPEGQFSRGLRSAALGMGGQANTLAGELGIRAGANDFARGRFSAADDYNRRAAEAAPRVTSVRDVHGFGDAVDYAAGLAGGAVPMVGTALGAAALTGGGALPSMLAGAGAMAPFSVGDVLQRQKSEGRPTDLRTAVLAGGADAAANALLPGLARAKLAGKAAVNSVAGQLAAIPEQAALSAAGEAAKQAGGGQKLDSDALVDAAAGGGIMGVPLAGVGALGAARKGAGGAKVPAGAGEASPGAPGEPAAPPSLGESAHKAVSDAFGSAKAAARGAVDRVRKGLPADLTGVAENPGALTREQLAKMDANTITTVQGWGEDMAAKAGLTDEQRAKLSTAMSDLGQEANRAYVAGLKHAVDAGKAATDAIDALHAHMTRRGEDIAGNESGSFTAAAGQLRDIAMPYLRAAPAEARKAADKIGERISASNLPDEVKAKAVAALKNPGEQANRAYLAAADFVRAQGDKDWAGVGDNIKKVSTALLRQAAEKGEKGVDHLQSMLDEMRAKRAAKASRDYGGFDEVVAQTILPALEEAHPGVGQNRDALMKAAAAVRSYMDRPENPDQATMMRLHDVFGHKTAEVLQEVRSRMGDRVGKDEDFFGALNQIQDHTRRDKALIDTLRSNLKPHLQDEMTMPQLRTIADKLSTWMRAPTDRTEKGMFFDHRVNQLIAEHFDKPEKVRAALMREAEPTKLERGRKGPRLDQDEHVGGSDAEFGTPETAVKLERLHEDAVPAPEAHRAEYGNEGKAERLIRQAKERDPNSESNNYRWMHASEYHKLSGEVAPDTDGLTKNLGYVVRESMEGSDKLTESAFNRFKYDTKKGDRRSDKAVIDVDGDGKLLLDATKLAHASNRSAAEVVQPGDSTMLARMAKTFAHNVAAATEYLGRSVHVDDDMVVGRRSNGKDITAGELRALHGSDSGSPGEMIPKLIAARSEAVKAGDMKLAGRLGDQIDRLEFKRDASLNEVETATYDDLVSQRASVVAEAQKARKAGDAKALGNAVLKGEAIERRMAKMRLDDEVLDSGARKDFNPDDEIHTAVARASKPDDVVHKFNMDGTPVSHKAVNSPAELYARADSGAQRGANGGLPGSKELPAPKPKPPAIDPIQRGIALENRAARELEKAVKQAGGLTEDHIYFDMGGQRYEVQQMAPGKFVVRDERGRAVASRGMEAGSTPSPKALAAKQAAFVEKARSGDQGLIDHIAASTDAASLQRAVTHLAGEKVTPEVQRVTDAINTRIADLIRSDPQTAYDLTKKSAQAAQPGHTQTAAEQASVKAYVDKVFAKTIKTEFANISHAGDFTRMKAADVIRVSVHALDPMGVAYHESLHGFFAKLDDTRNDSVKRVLLQAADGAFVRKQLGEFLKHSPDALKQLADPEERVAYMYQAWALGKLTVGPETRGVLTKIADYFRKALGMWTNDERAVHIMEHFQSGEYAKIMTSHDAVRTAYMEQGRNAALDKARAMTEPLTRLAESVGVAGGARLRDTGIPALRELADLVKATGRDAASDSGFIPAARTERTAVMNRIGSALSSYSKEQISNALEHMQKGSKSLDAKERAIQAIVGKQLADLKTYMEKAGVSVGDLGPDYFPRVYDAEYISRHQKDFITLLEKYGTNDAARIMHKIIGADGMEFFVERPSPGMQHLKLRKLTNIPNDELARFMSKDLYHTLNSYVTQATRRAEWARRFGDDSSKLEALLDQARKQGADNATVDGAKKYMLGVDGTLGDHINPTARRLMGDMIVYQNIRLLPLAIFSSLVDPAGIMVRGGTVGDAWTTFKRGIKEMRKNFQDAPGKDTATELAETMGVVDNAALVHSIGALYSQGMVGATGRKVNDTFFRFNLMEQFNTSMRVGAMEAAIGFIGRHADGTRDVHSKRWIAELGLKAGDVVLDAHGRPKLTEADGLTAEQAARMRTAVNRWVDGAVLRPDAADKPVWMNDPHFALISHLKQFVYSFHETIIKRVMHETEFGNYRPAMAMASYVPIMIASDMVKGLIQGGGAQPEWKDKWGADDYVWSGVQRAGMLGTGQFVVDAATHTGSLAGPTLEQFADAFMVLGGREQFKHFAVKSLPANALYASALNTPATDPAFAD